MADDGDSHWQDSPGGRRSKEAPDAAPPFARAHQLLVTKPVLPAQVRHRRVRTGLAASPSYSNPLREPFDFARGELTVKGLDNVVDLLWLAGFRGNVRPLHRHLGLDRRIRLTEDVSLHLLWRRKDIFMKPIPAFLTSFDSYQDKICDSADPYLQAAALGFLVTYTKLVCYETDLDIAKACKLIPQDVTFDKWTKFAADIIATADRVHRQDSLAALIVPRYLYGELRLSRVNLIYRLNPRFHFRHVFRGYYDDIDGFSDFLQSNFYWLAAILVYVNVSMTTFQVGLATNSGMMSSPFMEAAWVACIMSLVIILAGIVAIFGVAFITIAVNVSYAYGARLKRPKPKPDPER